MPAPSSPPQPTPQADPTKATPPEPANQPKTETPEQSAPLTDDELIAKGIPAELIEAAVFCGDKSATVALSTAADQIRAGSIVYLGRGADVIGPIGDDGLQLSLSNGSTAFLLGVDRSNVVSGDRVVPGLVAVRKTTNYQTILGGNRSGWVLEKIPADQWAKAQALAARRAESKRREELEAKLKQAQDDLAATPPKSFTSADGNFRTMATITDFADGSYTMQRDDGKEIRVADDQLDEVSQFTARSQLRRLIEAKKRIAQITEELNAHPSKPNARK
jgi:hypothetical protein